jgi:N-acyl-D-amino-acid deacylase
VGKDVLIPVHASHLWGPADDVAAGLDDAINGGVSISWDMYPYTAGSSLLAMVALPPSWQTESISRSVERLGRPTAHAELETLTMSTLPHLTVLMYIRGEKYRHLEGLSLTDAAARCGMDLWRFIAEILIDSRMGVAVIFHRPELHESDVWSVIERSGYTAGSDGVYLGSYPHPRSYATFTTVLARCLETDPVGGWSVAVDRLSTSAAERFQLGGRGRIVVGAPADIAVFQPDKVRVNASWEDPACPSSGLVDAFVSGEPVVIGGELTANRPGRALRL